MNFFVEDVENPIEGERQKVKNWVNKVLTDHDKKIGEINIIFCSDKYLHKLNKEYLNHFTFTDILTFNNSEEKNRIDADIFISTDRVGENAKKYAPSYRHELYRVIVHGFLHLIGYNDKTKEEEIEMRFKEDFYLAEIF